MVEADRIETCTFTTQTILTYKYLRLLNTMICSTRPLFQLAVPQGLTAQDDRGNGFREWGTWSLNTIGLTIRSLVLGYRGSESDDVLVNQFYQNVGNLDVHRSPLFSRHIFQIGVIGV